MASINDLAKPLIEISSIPGIETVVDVLNLDWEINEVNEDEVEIEEDQNKEDTEDDATITLESAK